MSGFNGLELVRDLGVWFVGVVWPESSMIYRLCEIYNK